MTNDNLHIACPKCFTTNKIANSRLNNNPKCGKCGQFLFDGNPIDLDDSNFTKFTKATEIPIIVDFWASWCAPCKIMAPIFKQAAEKLKPNVLFTKVNTEIALETSAHFNIRSIPTIVILKKGMLITQRPGAVSLDELIAWIEQNIK
jgi:thioredoxin 2